MFYFVDNTGLIIAVTLGLAAFVGMGLIWYFCFILPAWQNHKKRKVAEVSEKAMKFSKFNQEGNTQHQELLSEHVPVKKLKKKRPKPRKNPNK